jgi:hypothetical protein
MKYFRKILDSKQCKSIIDRIEELPQKVESFTGEIVERLHVSPEWNYNFYRLGKNEIIDIIEIIESKVPFEIVSFRIMHYPTGAKIGRHKDGWHPVDGPSDCGMTIQLSNPDDYVGGEFFMNDKVTSLHQGDGLYYTYDEPHEVKKIRHGERWIASIRAKLR